MVLSARKMSGRMARTHVNHRIKENGMMMGRKKLWVPLLCGLSELPFFRPGLLRCIYLLSRFLEFFPNPQALLQTYSSKDPKLILAVPASLSHGPSRHLFSDFAAVPDNVVLLTGRSEEGTLGRDLFEKWNDSQRPDDKWDKGKIGSNIMMDGVLKLRVCFISR